MAINKILIILLTLISTHTLSFGLEYEHPNNSYNKALEYYQQDDLGNAMFHTKRAILLKPTDKNIRELFYTIRKDIGLPQIYSDDSFSNIILSNLFSQLSPQINAIIGALLFLIGSLLVCLILLKTITTNKKVAIIGIWISFILSGINFLQAGIQYYIFFSPDQRIVLTTTKAYEEASFESLNLLDLPAGSEVQVIIQDQEFYLVSTLDGKEYWITPESIPPLWDKKQL